VALLRVEVAAVFGQAASWLVWAQLAFAFEVLAVVVLGQAA
jgi:hypothetical protein